MPISHNLKRSMKNYLSPYLDMRTCCLGACTTRYWQIFFGLFWIFKSKIKCVCSHLFETTIINIRRFTVVFSVVLLALTFQFWKFFLCLCSPRWCFAFLLQNERGLKRISSSLVLSASSWSSVCLQSLLSTCLSLLILPVCLRVSSPVNYVQGWRPAVFTHHNTFGCNTAVATNKVGISQSVAADIQHHFPVSHLSTCYVIACCCVA